MSERVKVISITHASNVTGVINPIEDVVKLAKKYKSLVSVDGSQAVPHISVNVSAIGCDFYSFSAHKMLGPTGVGVLWGKQEHLEKMEPVLFGGGMIDVVREQNSTWAALPERFEAGTPNIAGVIGLGAAIDYLNKFGMGNIFSHEQKITEYAINELNKIPGLAIIGMQNPHFRTGIISFTIKGVHAHDISSILDTKGIAVRSGHHCAMPLHTKLGISASTRASFYFYNDFSDIDKLTEGIKQALEILK